MTSTEVVVGWLVFLGLAIGLACTGGAGYIPKWQLFFVISATLFAYEAITDELDVSKVEFCLLIVVLACAGCGLVTHIIERVAN